VFTSKPLSRPYGWFWPFFREKTEKTAKMLELSKMGGSSEIQE